MPASAGGTENNTNNKEQNFAGYIKPVKIIAAPFFCFLYHNGVCCKQYSTSGNQFGWIG
jgi:hypothetical protein